MLPVLRIGVQGPLYQDKPHNMQHWQVTIIIQTQVIAGEERTNG